MVSEGEGAAQPDKGRTLDRSRGGGPAVQFVEGETQSSVLSYIVRLIRGWVRKRRKVFPRETDA